MGLMIVTCKELLKVKKNTKNALGKNEIHRKAVEEISMGLFLPPSSGASAAVPTAMASRPIVAWLAGRLISLSLLTCRSRLRDRCPLVWSLPPTYPVSCSLSIQHTLLRCGYFTCITQREESLPFTSSAHCLARSEEQQVNEYIHTPRRRMEMFPQPVTETLRFT